jgi:hypothetical protein
MEGQAVRVDVDPKRRINIDQYRSTRDISSIAAAASGAATV